MRRHVTADGSQLANLRLRLCFDGDFGSDAPAIEPALQTNDGSVAGRSIVLIDANGFIKIAHDQVEISVTIEVGRRRRKAHTDMVQAPVFADILKLQSADVAVGDILLTQFRRFRTYVFVPLCLTKIKN